MPIVYLGSNRERRTAVLNTQPLHPKFGVVVNGVDLTTVTATHLFPQIRAAFDEHSALLFRGQTLDAGAHTSLASLFGPLENRPAMSSASDVPFAVSPVSNQRKGGSVSAETDLHTRNLKANMLWHTDSTFLPVPALVNILAAKLVSSSGGQTELASMRAGYEEMPDGLRTQLDGAILWHRLSHSRARIDSELGALPQMNRWPDRPWRAVWKNPVNGRKSAYVASHAFAVEDMGPEAGASLIDEAISFCTRPGTVYSHTWEVGDVLIWDERAMLHRGQPWPYEEPRTLMSICCSATDADGLRSVRII